MPSESPGCPAWRAWAAGSLLLAWAAPGCGRPEPAPLTAEQFEKARKNAEAVHAREVGRAARDKAAARRGRGGGR